MWKSSRRRRAARGVFVFAAVLALTLMVSSAALADGNGATTFTQTFHNAVQTMPSNNPCTGASGNVTLVYNGVFHYTINKAGDFWDTSNQTGTFTFVPDDTSQPSYTGTFHMWFGDSFNNHNQVNHFTFQVHGIGSDGSTLDFHETAHFSVSASGMVQTFDKPVCG